MLATVSFLPARTLLRLSTTCWTGLGSTSGARLRPTLLLAMELGISASCPWARGTRIVEPALIFMRTGMRLISRNCSSVAPVCLAACATVTVSDGTQTVQLASRLSPIALRFCLKTLTLSYGNRICGVTEAMMSDRFAAGFRALKSSTLMPANCAAMATSISRLIATFSK